MYFFFFFMKYKILEYYFINLKFLTSKFWNFQANECLCWNTNAYNFIFCQHRYAYLHRIIYIFRITVSSYRRYLMLYMCIPKIIISARSLEYNIINRLHLVWKLLHVAQRNILKKTLCRALASNALGSPERDSSRAMTAAATLSRANIGPLENDTAVDSNIPYSVTYKLTIVYVPRIIFIIYSRCFDRALRSLWLSAEYPERHQTSRKNY